MITYNHEKFIVQAIEGVVMQETDFPFELVIGEDCSSDRTREIVQSFAERYPNIIRPLYTDRNLGMQVNANRTLQACKGKYIAFCEGDDYWTDSRKLSKQIKFLDQHPDYSICCHDVSVHYENGEYDDYCFYPNDVPRGPIGIHNHKPPETTDLNRLLGGNYIQTVSVVMRNVLRQGMPGWVSSLSMGDWILNILAARHGHIFFIDEVMAVYRVHSGGVWSCIAAEQRMKGMLEASCAIRDNVNLAFQEEIALNCYILDQSILLAKYMRDQGNRAAARDIYKKMLLVRGSMSVKVFLAVCVIVVKRLLPREIVRCLFGLWAKAKQACSQLNFFAIP